MKKTGLILLCLGMFFMTMQVQVAAAGVDVVKSPEFSDDFFQEPEPNYVRSDTSPKTGEGEQTAELLAAACLSAGAAVGFLKKWVE